MTSRGETDYSLNAGKENFGGRGESVNAYYSYTFEVNSLTFYLMNKYSDFFYFYVNTGDIIC